MKRKRVTIGMMGLLLSGCSISTLQMERSRPVKAETNHLEDNFEVVDRVGKQDEGVLSFSIRWPQTDAVRIQVLPQSARLLRMAVYDASDKAVAMLDVVRDTQSVASSGRLVLPAASGYRLDVKAFAAAQPGPGDEVLARGEASNITIRKSRTTGVGLQMAPTTAPGIESLQPPDGGVGRTVRVKGRNFGATRSLPLAVRFNGTAASSVNRIDNTTIEVVVPDGATTGTVAVQVDGVESVSSAFFAVTKSISFSPFEGYFLTGSTRSLVVRALDTRDSLIPLPSLTWSVDKALHASIDPFGMLTSLGSTSATVEIRATTGIVSNSLRVPIWPKPVTVEVIPGSGMLNAQAVDGLNDPGFITHLPIRAVVTYVDLSTDSSVVWAVSDPSLGAVQNGEVIAAIDAPTGLLTVTAASVRDPQIKGQAAFTITTLGNAEVTVD